MTITEEHVYLQLYARAPAPCRDYYGLTVSSNFVILNIWNISHGPHVYPRRLKTPLNEFSEDKYLQSEIRRLFGEHVLTFTTGLAARECNLQYLPAKIFLRILRHLAANDILRLSQTSKIFFEFCNTEAAWKIIFRKRVRKLVHHRDIARGEGVGWKEIVREKLNLMMHTGTGPLSKHTASNNKIFMDAKSQNLTQSFLNKFESTKSKKISNDMAPKKLNTKEQELNNKIPSTHPTSKKQELNVIKNVAKDVNGGQLNTGGEKIDNRKINVAKSARLYRKAESVNLQTAKQNATAKGFLKLPERGDGTKNNFDGAFNNSLHEKTSSKNAQLPKVFSKFNGKY